MTATVDPLGPLVPLLENSPRQTVAREGMILRVMVGSEVLGTSVSAHSDHDEMGVCIEPPSTTLGLSQFEHYGFRTKPEGVVSGPGDLDLIVYSLRKYARLAAQGNPSVLVPLFVPQDAVLYRNPFGDRLRAHRDLFLSRRAGPRFRGYLHRQREGLLGLRSGGTRNQGRADIRAEYGFDTKFAMHMVRLGIQGVELLSTGAITLPIPEPDRTWLRELRVGKHSKQDALDRAAELEARISELMADSPLPEQPDWRALDAWLVDMHRVWWSLEEDR